MACFTRQEAKDLWDYAKEKYLKVPHPTKGYMDFKTLTNALSDDIYKATGGPNGGRRIVPEDIAKLIATPKTILRQRKTLLLADRNRSGALRQARDFTSQTEKTPLNRFLKTAYQLPYSGKVVGHSAALHMTHAWPSFFDPVQWRNFGRTWVNAWKAMSPSRARAISESIMLDPNFDEQVNSGLSVDPRKIYDDVQQRAGFWGKLGEMTSNSFIGLKQFRQAEWNRIWDTVPDHLKTDEMRKLVSLRVNHMTGTPGPEGSRAMSGRVGETIRAVAFAPSLDIARVMRPVDLLQDVGTSIRAAANKLPVAGDTLKKLWGQASPEARWVARENMKKWTRIAATYSAMLYANHLVLKHFFGSKEDVNVADPLKPDWIAAKGPNGRIVQATGGQIPMIRTGIKMVANPKEAGDTLGTYLIGKVNPIISIAKGAATGKSFSQELPAPLGKGPSTFGSWAEYATTELGPIATEDGIHEFSKQMTEQNGVPYIENQKFLNAVLKAGLVTIPSVAGTHSYELENKTKSSKPLAAGQAPRRPAGTKKPHLAGQR